MTLDRGSTAESPEELAAEARGLLRRKRWSEEDAAAAWELVPTLVEEDLQELADRLIYALERYEVGMGAAGL